MSLLILDLQPFESYVKGSILLAENHRVSKAQFYIDKYATPFRLDKNINGGSLFL